VAVLALEPVHIDSKEHSITQNSKGKGHCALVKILEMLRDYYKVYKPIIY
jgi:integrase/recombinase XerD